MNAWIDAVRTGAWLTRERVRLWSVAVLLASFAGALWLVAGSNGLIDSLGRPLGTDFSNVYAAGTYVLDGHPAAPWNPPLQYAREQALFGPDTQFYGWHYPPFFLFVAAPLARLPYGAALAIWQATTLLLYLGAVALIVRAGLAGTPGDAGPPAPEAAAALRLWPLVALAYPAVFVNLGHGHNGFLTAALAGAGLVWLDRRPLLAGVLLGLLAYKPQFGLLLPLVLAATGRWRAFAAAGATVAALIAAATLAFGPAVWSAFAESTAYTRSVVLETGETGWEKIQSVFSAIRMWGGSVGLAYAGQGIVTAALAVALVLLWRSEAPYPRKAAALILGMVLATPYALDYDLMVLAPAIAFLAVEGLRRGFAPWLASALAALWIAPLVTRSVAKATTIPLGLGAMLVMAVLLLGSAAMRRKSVAEPPAA